MEVFFGLNLVKWLCFKILDILVCFYLLGIILCVGFLSRNYDDISIKEGEIGYGIMGRFWVFYYI